MDVYQRQNHMLQDDDPLLANHQSQSADNDDPLIDTPLAQPLNGGDFTLYKRRWYILLVIVILNISSGMVSLNYLTLVNLTMACAFTNHDGPLEIHNHHLTSLV